MKALLMAGVALAFGTVTAQPLMAKDVRKPTLAAAKLAPVATINLTTLSQVKEPGTLPQARLAKPGNLPETRLVPAPGMPRAFAPRAPMVGPVVGAQPMALNPAAKSMSSVAAGPLAFDGLSNYDQRFADNGNQFSLEPPDQALAASGKYVVQAVNNGITVFDTAGKQLIPTVSTNRFFGLQSALNRATGQFGPSLSDPRAYFDADSQRWFVFEWVTITDASGNPLGATYQFFAVSKNADPTGNWSIYSFDTTNSDLPGCPCIPDYQQIGFDKNGIYVTHNLFGNNTGAGYVAATLYAFSKPGIVQGTGSSLSRFVLPEDFTVHPAVVPPKGTFASDENGTQYFLEGLADIDPTGTASAVRVFALSGTNTLGDFFPNIALSSIDVPTQTYTEPFLAVQPDGPRPYAASLVKAGRKRPPVPLLSTGSARFGANPFYVNGSLWGVLSTGVPSPAGGKSALAYFALGVSGGATTLAATVQQQGVIVAPGETSLAYGAIAMPTNGRGGVGFQLSGPGNYPSTGYAPLSTAGAGSLSITGIGAVPLDGFTGYNSPPFTSFQGVERWGDYSAASVVGANSLWFAGEYAPDPAVKPRTLGVNWGSAITNVRR